MHDFRDLIRASVKLLRGDPSLEPEGALHRATRMLGVSPTTVSHVQRLALTTRIREESGVICVGDRIQVADDHPDYASEWGVLDCWDDGVAMVRLDKGGLAGFGPGEVKLRRD